jgi:hypothetical protein
MDLIGQLERTSHQPCDLKSPGACVALACHTTMVCSGFTPEERHEDALAVSPTRRSHRSPYEPPTGWQESSDTAWSFRFTKFGMAKPITLCCAVLAEDDL